VILGEESKQAAGEAVKLGDAADEPVDLLAESAKAADASVDLLAESELCEPLDSEEEANYSSSTYWSGSNSTDRGSNSTESGSNTTESTIATPRANLAYLVSNRDLSLDELESKDHSLCQLLTAMGFDGRHFKVELPRKPAPKRKEAPTSAAYDQKFYVELSEASTAGKTFALTGGKHMTSTDIQIALELKKRKKESKGLAVKKAKATRESKESELDAKVLA
jgi:hypothetical protein